MEFLVSRRSGPCLLAFAPDAEYLAAGNVTDLGTPEVRVFSVTTTLFGDDLVCLGQFPCPSPLCRLAWSKSRGELPMGLVAGGLSDGSVRVWNPRPKAEWEFGSYDPNNDEKVYVENTRGPSRLKANGVSKNQMMDTRKDLTAEGVRKSKENIAEGIDHSWEFVENPGFTVGEWDVLGGDNLLGLFRDHAAQVHGLSFSHESPNFLASGSTGKIVVLDVSRLGSETVPVFKINSTDVGMLSCLSWNYFNANLMASTSFDGINSLWDIRMEGPLKWRLPLEGRCSFVEWSPRNENFFVIAKQEKDDLPAITLWDARNSGTYIQEFCPHSTGIGALSWSPHDDCILLACTDNDKTTLWNVGSDEAKIVREIEAPGICYDAQWSRSRKGIIAYASHESISLYSLH